MSVFKKLNDARSSFHALKLEKTGLNKFAGYNYFELGDFLIPAMGVFRDFGLCAVVSFDKETARMTITDVDKPEDAIVITSPMGSAALKGCHEVQNVGAVETYQRRYLWVAALEIVEHDALDATTGKGQEARGIVIKPTEGADAFVSDTARRGHLEKVAAYLIECYKEENAPEAVATWNNKENFEHNEERIFVWNLLASYSKLRGHLKKNEQ